MLVKQTGNLVLTSLHPAAVLSYMVVVVTGALLLTQPVLLMIIFLAVLISLLSAGGGLVWIKSVKYFLVMIIMYMIINSLVNNLGATILWPGIALPVLGRVSVSLEVIVYSLVMALRLLIIYSAFILYNFALDPDRTLSLFAGVFPRSTLLVALATKSIPYLGQQVRRVAEIQQTRGIQYHNGSFYQRIKNRIPLLKVVFLSSLEDSFNVGESIQARAYGSGPRTRYAALSFKLFDHLIMAAALVAALVIAWSYFKNFGSLHFFPHISGYLLSESILAAGGLIALSLLVPAAVIWGCKRWHYFM